MKVYFLKSVTLDNFAPYIHLDRKWIKVGEISDNGAVQIISNPIQINQDEFKYFIKILDPDIIIKPGNVFKQLKSIYNIEYKEIDNITLLKEKVEELLRCSLNLKSWIENNF